MPERPVLIAGVGAAVPDQVLSSEELGRRLGRNGRWIVERTGIRERRIAPPHLATSDLAVAAGREALADAGLSPGEIGLVILATSTPDHILPPTACLVQHQLGCNSAGAFDVGATCTGFLTALSIGAQYIRSSSCRAVLVIGANVVSRLANWSDASSCILFGDGAGAVILIGGESDPKGTRRGVIYTRLRADGAHFYDLYVPAGGSRQPITSEALERGLNTITMDGRVIFRLAVEHLERICRESLADCDLTASDLDWFVPHQANQRIIDAVAQRLRIPVGKVVSNIASRGNTSAASIPLALHEAARGGMIRPGHLVLMAAFGGGLTEGAALAVW